MAIIPALKLYASNGSSLLYTFTYVQPPLDIPRAQSRTVVHKGQRSTGAIFIDGGEDTWELVVRWRITAADYEALIVVIDGIESAIAANTKLVLKFDKTSTTTYDYNVLKMGNIKYIGNSKRTRYQDCEVTFLVNSW